MDSVIASRPTIALAPGLGEATARRTYLRRVGDRWETQEEWAARVAAGSVRLLGLSLEEARRIERLLLAGRHDLLRTPLEHEALALYHGIRTGALVLAGRHLQHCDPELADRNIEVVTNCSTAASTALLFYLLLNGSGVGRSYDDDVIVADWRRIPEIILVLDPEHPDYGRSVDGYPFPNDVLSPAEGLRRARALAESRRRGVQVTVADSREGWAQAVEVLETACWRAARGLPAPDFVLLDFSRVRPKGSPIRGMQNRPASGPVPLMHALRRLEALRGRTDIQPWEAAMIADHELAAVVVVGGVRRSARIAIKSWDEPDILRFIEFKRRLEHRNAWGIKYWSSNNSVGVDRRFWELVGSALEKVGDLDDRAGCGLIGWISPEGAPIFPGEEAPEGFTRVEGAVYRLFEPGECGLTEEERRAINVFLAATACAFYDETGEPGFLSLDLLDSNPKGLDVLIEQLKKNPAQVVGSPRYRISSDLGDMLAEVGTRLRERRYRSICNPCGEIPLSILGGYCVIGSVAAANLVRDYQRVGERPTLEEELTHAALLVVRHLMRVNRLPALYQGEVLRTQRIGVGITGLHEVYLAHFGIGFKDVVSEEVARVLLPELGPPRRPLTEAEEKAVAFWRMVGRVSQAVREEADRYADELGVERPHTVTMIAPNGSTAKLYGITEGAHLPAMRYYLRNVQFSAHDPLVESYRQQGYPVCMLRQYPGKALVGFPTAPFITELAERLGLSHLLVTASEATPEEQYRWVMLLERYWLRGAGRDGQPTHVGGQVSYTLKFDPDRIGYADFYRVTFDYQQRVRAVSVIVQRTWSPDPYGLRGRIIQSGPYEYLPEQPISKAIYEELLRRTGRALEEDIGREHLDCGAGGCPIDFREQLAA